MHLNDNSCSDQFCERSDIRAVWSEIFTLALATYCFIYKINLCLCIAYVIKMWIKMLVKVLL